MRIPLSGGFTLVPEGKHIFKITKVETKDDFGKVVITLVTENGAKHVERYSLMNKDGEWVDGAINAFSIFVKTALNDFTLEEIDTSEIDKLVGHYIAAVVTHEEYTDNSGTVRKTSRLGNKEVSTGWDTEPEVAKGGFNLDDILG